MDDNYDIYKKIFILAVFFITCSTMYDIIILVVKMIYDEDKYIMFEFLSFLIEIIGLSVMYTLWIYIKYNENDAKYVIQQSV